MIPTEADALHSETALEKTARRSAMGQLLHALNQPLTGLQCSMEVALASPRTAEQYARGLREGLALTERMRALVEAMREVADIEEEKTGKQDVKQTTEVISLLREAVQDLAPVAEVKNVRMALDLPPAFSFAVRAGRAQMASAILRLVDSTLSLAARGTELHIEAESGTDEVWIRMWWQAEGLHSAFSRPELGLLIVQARLEQSGAEWQRAQTEARETLTIRLPCVSFGVL
jgi:signal transduction histidine kinase